MVRVMNQDIPCKTITTFNFPNIFKVLPLEVNLTNKKIFVIGCYKPMSLHNEYLLDQLHSALSFRAPIVMIFFC